MEDIKWENLMAVLEEYGQKVKGQYQENLLNNDHIAHGKLFSPINVYVPIKGTVIKVELELQKYWKFVEFNTKPHYPPIEPLLDWVHIKGLPTEENTGNKALPTEKQLAYWVQKKIAKKGTIGTHDLSYALDTVNEEYMEKIKDAIRQDITSNLVLIDVTFR